VRALGDLMERDDVYGEVFNIGSQHEVRIMELAEMVKQATGSSSEIELVPYDEAYEEGFEDMQRRIPDTTRIKDRIGWEPQKSLDEILADVIAEHRAGGD
jgi:UDP-glucose 4-epimerase